MSHCQVDPMPVLQHSSGFTVALAGNPNAGKSTIFNALTGSRQHVGNWPGKTVEKKSGTLKLNSHEITIVDLPGTYSLSAFSVEEIIARDFIVEDNPGAVVAVVDAANLERNLYLVMQLLEMQIPLMLALTMTDVAERRQIRIDTAQLEKLLGVPIVSMVGTKDIGFDDLKNYLQQFSAKPRLPENHHLLFDENLENALHQLQTLITADEQLSTYPTRWLAIKLLEDDQALTAKITHNPQLQSALAQIAQELEVSTGEAAEILIADTRYTHIAEITRQVVQRPALDVLHLSDRIDQLLTHRVWGIPIFFLMMWLVFQFTANVSAPYVDWIDGVIAGPITNQATALLTSLNLKDTWVAALVTDGMIASVGGILVFIPVLMTLFLAIAVLEDSGYMARAAFLMDRFMSLLGMHGKSFLPLIVGFGCTVPAIYATRTLDNEQDRKITAFLTTFMSCGARLPVYVIFGAAFFGSQSGNLIFGMYLLGIFIAVLTNLLLTKIVYKEKPIAPFVMELPPYRVPSPKSVWLNMWQRTAAFIQKAGTTILAASVAIWLLLAIPVQSGGFADVEPKDSAYGSVSEVMSPLFAPAGFGEWQASGSLISGIVAKEVIVSSMTQVYVGPDDETQTEVEETPTLAEDAEFVVTSFGESTILTTQEFINIAPRTINLLPGVEMGEVQLINQDAGAQDNSALETELRDHFSPLAAVTFSIFVLLYVPCMTSIGAMRHEFGTRWMWIQIFYTFGVAWLTAVIVYQGGMLLGWGG